MGSETIESEAIYFPVSTAEHAVDAAGGHASVTGEAVHEPAAAVRVSDDLTVDMPEVGTWPEDVIGRNVTVKGRILESDGGRYRFETILYEVEGE